MAYSNLIKSLLLAGLCCGVAAATPVVVTVDAGSLTNLPTGAGGCRTSITTVLTISCEVNGPANASASAVIHGRLLCDGTPCRQGTALPFSFTNGASDDTVLFIGLDNPLGGEDLGYFGGYGFIGLPGSPLPGPNTPYQPAGTVNGVAYGYPNGVFNPQQVGFELELSATSLGGPSAFFPRATGYSFDSVTLPVTAPEPGTIGLLLSALPILLLAQRRFSAL